MTKGTGVGDPTRIVTLDIVRGVAMMGILAMNIAAFALPRSAYFNPAAWGTETVADLAAWAVNFVLIDGKMRGLFSFLFGAGIVLVAERAEISGRDPGAVHVRRMAWLFGFGAAHYFLVWWGDILTLYAALGLVAILFAGNDTRSLVRTGIIFIVIHFVVSLVLAGGYFAASAAAAAPGADQATIAQWQAMAGGFGASPAASQAEIALYRGDYSPILAERLGAWSWPVFSILVLGFETLGYFLLGMAAYRSGFLTGAWDDRRYRTWALAGLAIGLPAYAALAYFIWRSDFSIPLLYLCAITLPTLVRPALIVAYAALIILATRRGGWLTKRIAAAGRMAFSNYLGSSLVMTTLFYGYGVGLFGTLSRLELWLPVVAMWLAMLAWSKPWLDRFAYGPFEWAWRSLARGKLQPMRRQIRPND